MNSLSRAGLVVILVLVALVSSGLPALGQEVVTTIPVTSLPYAVAVNPSTNLVYVAHRGIADTVTVIDGATDQVVTTIHTKYGAFDVVVNTNNNEVYVGGNQRISIIDGNPSSPTFHTITGFILLDGPRPHMAVDEATNRLYVNSNGYMMVVDGASHDVVAMIPYVGADGVAVNPNTHIVYATSDHWVAAIDGKTNTLVAKIPLSSPRGIPDPQGLAVNPKTNLVYVAHEHGGLVSVIDGDPDSPTFHTELTTIKPGTNQDKPMGVAVNVATGHIFVTNAESSSVSVINGRPNSPAFNTAIARINVGYAPHGVAWNPITNRIYVANTGIATVAVIQD